MAIGRYHTKDPLIYWATEREKIRVKKAQGLPPPWTTDEILQRYRFCNVRRINDRVSQWMVYNVLQHQAEFDDQLVFLKWVALCRWVNWPPTLSVILGAPSHPEEHPTPEDYVTYDSINLAAIGNAIDNRCAIGYKAWTGAYMVRAPSKKKYPGMSKGKFVAEVVVGGLDTIRDKYLDWVSPIRPSAEAVWKVIRSVPNFGPFMAGQVVADLTYTDLLGGAYDLNTWAPQGPGSIRGFNRLMGRPLKQKVEDAEWREQLQKWREKIALAIGSELTLHDAQNCLCEIDKYLRAKNGEGRPRSIYKPETAY